MSRRFLAVSCLPLLPASICIIISGLLQTISTAYSSRPPIIGFYTQLPSCSFWPPEPSADPWACYSPEWRSPPPCGNRLRVDRPPPIKQVTRSATGKWKNCYPKHCFHFFLPSVASHPCGVVLPLKICVPEKRIRWDVFFRPHSTSDSHLLTASWDIVVYARFAPATPGYERA